MPTRYLRQSPIAALVATGLFPLISAAEPPILTDEFDAFLVTKDSELGEIIGKIRPVFPNELPPRWSLIKPVPGADRRRYLQDGQADATGIVAIDEQTGELRLIRQPEEYPLEYYAQVRASNDDGYMDQVLIIIARAETPKPENYLAMFTQRKSASGLDFYATARVDPAKVDHAGKVASALLRKDRENGGPITAHMKNADAAMIIFKDFEERNTAIEFYLHADDFHGQDLQDEEIIPDYFRLGGPIDRRPQTTRIPPDEEQRHSDDGRQSQEARPRAVRDRRISVPDPRRILGRNGMEELALLQGHAARSHSIRKSEFNAYTDRH